MQKIAFVIYRNWAFQIFEKIRRFKKIRDSFDIPLLITTKDSEFKEKLTKLPKAITVLEIDGSDNTAIENALKERGITLVLFYGWSWIIKGNILKNYLCMCLHPSLLPKYRGGTPIQNQLINGETESAVTIFKMGEGIDDGDIYKQEKMSLSGNIEDIFARIVNLGTLITKQLISDLDNGGIKLVHQKNLLKNPPHKRRTKEQSEIQFNNLSQMSYDQLNNLVRGLRDPFPNAFIRFKTFVLYILEVQKYSVFPKVGRLITKDLSKRELKGPLFLKLKDSFAKLVEFKL